MKDRVLVIKFFSKFGDPKQCYPHLGSTVFDMNVK
jgi:hypothetical protein